MPGDVIKPIIKRIFLWIITGCRVLIGLVVMKTGFDVIRGKGAFAYWKIDDGITGIFFIILGVYIDFSSLSHQVFDQSK